MSPPDVFSADEGGPSHAYGPDGPGLGMAEGFSRSIGMHMEEVTGSRVTGWVDVGPQHLQPGSIVHGGLYAAVVEEAASYGASFAVRHRGQRVVGVANSTNFIRSVTAGRILVEAVALQQGRTQQFWEVRMTQAEDGRLVALGHLRLQNLLPPPD
ncbi:MAG TPA: PaaI family thioesterase [Acidimicrobiales bacterium]|nr:PaaI family thioesterase [Acidimicrobiales bacterium]